MRYYHFESVEKQKRRKKKIIKIAAVFICVLAAGYVVILRDLVKKQEVVVKESGEVKSITKLDNYIPFEESKFTIMLPAGWQRSKDSSSGIFRYKSGEQSHEAIQLDIYTGAAIPADFNTIRALPIEIENGKIKPGLISDRCYNFTKPKEGFGENIVSPPQPSVWQGAKFNCNFSKVLNYAATVNTKTGYVTEISGPSGSGTYLFAYTDHTSRPDFLVFNNILSTFTHK